MMREGITINELSKMANVTVRTIRFYTDEGVLDEPAGRDRYARYTRRHFLQLNVARALKERFYPLRVIRDRMASMTESELEQIGGPIPAHIEARFAEAEDAVMPMKAANAYQSLKLNSTLVLSSRNMYAADVSDERTIADMALHETVLPPPDVSAITDVAPQSYAGPSAIRASAAVGDMWHRVAVAPGIELHIREDAMQESAGEIRRIIASLRKR
jgi:DNA-binding transcriptional MerR regulator